MKAFYFTPLLKGMAMKLTGMVDGVLGSFLELKKRFVLLMKQYYYPYLNQCG